MLDQRLRRSESIPGDVRAQTRDYGLLLGARRHRSDPSIEIIGCVRKGLRLGDLPRHLAHGGSGQEKGHRRDSNGQAENDAKSGFHGDLRVGVAAQRTIPVVLREDAPCKATAPSTPGPGAGPQNYN